MANKRQRVHAGERSREVVAFGFLGTQLDRGEGDPRWERWRPTVALGMHEDLLLDRLELIVPSSADAWLPQVIADLEAVSPETEVRCHVLDLRDPWDFDEVFTALLDLVIGLDVQPEQEDLLVHITTGTHVAQICLFLLTEAGYLPGRLLQQAPPHRKGRPGSWNVIDLDLSRYDRIATRFERETDEALDFLKAGIATRNESFNRLIERIEYVASRARDPILLAGPTGAGKSRLARRIFDLRRGRKLVAGRFVEVNCATLRGDAAMSALFGHEAGAFTGAAKAREGLLRAADGGVLFLDEIGELGMDEQAMLLRAIEEKRFLPVGADREVESDFQLLAGSNRDLRARARSGAFRADLLARIDLWTFTLPGLRDRVEDIEPNLDFELAQRAAGMGRHISMNREARERFLGFACAPEATWSGNFRDLGGSVTRMSTLAPRGRIDLATVEEEIACLEQAWQGAEDGEASGKAHSKASAGEALLRALLGSDGSEALDRFERVQLADVVLVCAASASLSEAGRCLFAASRRRRKTANDADRLRKFLLRHGLHFEQIKRHG